MMDEKNIGGYDDNYIFDRRAVNRFENFLLRAKCLIVPHLNTEDKIPNLDGYLELCVEGEGKIIPKGRFEVQIKSLNHDYSNSNMHVHVEDSYKYSCDTKVVNVVLEELTLNPVLLILVDNQSERIFWKYMSVSYCRELNIGTQKYKTIYFNDSDKISDLDGWYYILKNIYISISERLNNDSLKVEKEKTVSIELQKMSDYLNTLLDHELWFIKEEYFPDTWKIGIAYLERGDDEFFSSVGLYQIKNRNNDLLIKGFQEEAEYFCRVQYGGRYSLEDIIRQILERWIITYFKKESYHYSLFPDIVLQELVFKAVDSRIAKMAMKNQSDEKVVLGWRGSDMLISELDSILSDYSGESDLHSLKQELNRRNCSIIHRPWKKLVDFHVEKRTEHVTSYTEDGDRELTERENRECFFKNLGGFFEDNAKMFGSRSEQVFAIKGKYIFIANDELTRYTFAVKKADSFLLDFHLRSETEEFADCQLKRPPVPRSAARPRLK